MALSSGMLYTKCLGVLTCVTFDGFRSAASRKVGGRRKDKSMNFQNRYWSKACNIEDPDIMSTFTMIGQQLESFQ